MSELIFELISYDNFCIHVEQLPVAGFTFCIQSENYQEFSTTTNRGYDIYKLLNTFEKNTSLQEISSHLHEIN